VGLEGRRHRSCPKRSPAHAALASDGYVHASRVIEAYTCPAEGIGSVRPACKRVLAPLSPQVYLHYDPFVGRRGRAL
jgi:hypothetical protein